MLDNLNDLLTKLFSITEESINKLNKRDEQTPKAAYDDVLRHLD